MMINESIYVGSNAGNFLLLAILMRFGQNWMEAMITVAPAEGDRKSQKSSSPLYHHRVDVRQFLNVLSEHENRIVFCSTVLAIQL
jgi:hypothetical protein